jgi:hypothetical protein
MEETRSSMDAAASILLVRTVRCHVRQQLQHAMHQ